VVTARTGQAFEKRDIEVIAGGRKTTKSGAMNVSGTRLRRLNIHLPELL
jgi:hypothetical protein